MSAGALIQIAYFHEWLVLNEKAANERFNIVDDSEFTWMRAWTQIAKWHGDMEWTSSNDDESAYGVQEMPFRPRG